MELLKTRLILDTVLGVAALAVSIASFFYFRGQAFDIRSQADATKQQVEVMRQQLEIAKSQVSSERNYAAVLSRTSLEALSGPLPNKKLITLRYTNRSSHTQSYEIKVKSTGFGVCGTDTCKDLSQEYSCDKDATTVVAPNQAYDCSFYIIHPRFVKDKATLTILLNDQERTFEYMYDADTYAYVRAE